MIMSIEAFKRFPALTDRNTANLNVAAGQEGESSAVPLNLCRSRGDETHFKSGFWIFN